MKRRDFFRNGAALTATTALFNPFDAWAGDSSEQIIEKLGKKAKNIIFLVSDGMSSGTLNMAHLLLQRQYGKSSRWLELYQSQKAKRSLMDTASASSLVTDSAAGGSAWGGGVRVPNGAINVGVQGELYQPILQKMKAVGKAVGCVTTVPITHATPASFCVNSKSRNGQAEIAEMYLPLRFDVMMGGGLEYFSGNLRKDKKDLLAAFEQAGYQVLQHRNQMLEANASKPILGVFHEAGLPYSLDRMQEKNLQEQVPTLAEMTQKAIDLMKGNPKGFVMQVEGGKVDWAAHANDPAALLYDQIAFDEALGVALDFAEKDKNTLVIVTTDHGNANPGLFYGKEADKNFDKIQKFRYSNDWVLQSIKKDMRPEQVVELIEFAQGIVFKKEEAEALLTYYRDFKEEGTYNSYKLPFRKMAELQTQYTSISWAGIDHSADFVELTAFGPGAEALKPFVKNYELHNFMLQTAGLKVK